jgi:hypothetical protein
MLTAYTSGGAPARLQLLAPFDTDGHDLIYNAPPETWLPAAESFLAELRLPTASVITLPEPATLPPPPAGLASICQEGFAAYLAYRSDAKAFATDHRGSCGLGRGRTTHEALGQAISECQNWAHGGTVCQIYAVGQHFVGY